MKYFRFIILSLLITMICILSSCNKPGSGITPESTDSHDTDSTCDQSAVPSDDLGIHEHEFVGLSCTVSGKCACGATTEALGHDFTEATCTDAGSCKRCGAETEALGHDFTEATCTDAGSCKRCGAETDALGHDFTEATCNDAGTCKRCGAETDALGHDFTGATCTDAGTCKRCGAETDALGHDFTGATCTDAGTCKRCGAKSQPLGHDFTVATCTAAGSCRRCGILYGSPLGHSYSGGRCIRCNDTNGPLKPDEALLFQNRLSDEENAQALAVARRIVEQINEQLPDGSDFDRIGMAAILVSDEYRKGVHKEEGLYFTSAYGVFIKRESSCAGCTSALGLVLSCMGYEWTHVNKNLWTHQWVTLTIDGETIWADGQVGWVGYGKHPVEGWSA